MGSEIVGFGAVFDRDQVRKDVGRALAIEGQRGPSETIAGLDIEG